MSRTVVDSYFLIKVGEEADLAPAQDQARDKKNFHPTVLYSEITTHFV